MNSEKQNTHTYPYPHLPPLNDNYGDFPFFFVIPSANSWTAMKKREIIPLLTRAKALKNNGKETWASGYSMSSVGGFPPFFKAIQMTSLQKLQSLGTWKYRATVPIAVT